MSGYSLPFEQFRFVASFNSVPNYISDKQVIWNFGDGTTSTDLTAYHSYTYPGVYNTTLTYFRHDGYSSVSTYTSAINVYNLISDQIILTTNTDVQESGQYTNPIFLTRYNSYQTTVTGRNTVIQLAVSGNQSQFATAEQYYSDKNAQFKSLARFGIQTDLGLTVVNEVSTTNDTIYAIPNGSNILTTINPTGNVSYVAGSSGTALFYYIEDANIHYIAPTPSVTPTLTPTASITPTPSLSPSTSPLITPSITPTHSPTASITPSVTHSASILPTVTPTASVTPSLTPTASITLTVTPSLTPSVTHTISITPTASITPSFTITPTASITPTLSPTPTSSVSPTASIVPTLTPTASVTPTYGASQSVTPTITPTASLTPSPSPSYVPAIVYDPWVVVVQLTGNSQFPQFIPTSTTTGVNGGYMGNLVIDSLGSLYTVTLNSNTSAGPTYISKITPTDFTTGYTSNTAWAMLSSSNVGTYPYSVIDTANNIYTAWHSYTDSYSGLGPIYISKTTPDGTSTLLTTITANLSGSLQYGTKIVLDKSNNLYVTNANYWLPGSITKITSGGIITNTWSFSSLGTGTGKGGIFQCPSSLVQDSSGNTLIFSTSSIYDDGPWISQITPSGNLTQKWINTLNSGIQGGGTNRFNNIVIDSYDNIYYGTSNDALIQVTNTGLTGRPYTYANGFTAFGPAASVYDNYLTIDNSNNVYVQSTGTLNQGIYKVSPLSASPGNHFGSVTLIYSMSGSLLSGYGFNNSPTKFPTYGLFDNTTDFLYIQTLCGTCAGVSQAFGAGAQGWQSISRLKVDNLPPLPSFSVTPTPTPTPTPTLSPTPTSVNTSPSPTPSVTPTLSGAGTSPTPSPSLTPTHTPTSSHP